MGVLEPGVAVERQGTLAGKRELDNADFYLRPVQGESLRTLAHRAHKKGLET